MIIINNKIRTCLTCAIIFLLTAALLSGCSGCSKSGLIRERYKAVPADSIDKSRSPAEQSGDSSELTDLLLTKFPAENSVEVQSGNEADSENMIPIGENVYGRVVSIVDGDTYDILIDGNKTLRIRMEGIDAPEKGMPFYQVAKNYLGKLCFSKNVKVRVTDRDTYARYVGFTYLDDGRELSHEMIEAGYAWHYKQYNSDSDLSGLEVRARDMKSGLWADKNQLPPWTVRTLHNKGISTKNLFILDSLNQ